MENFGSIIRFKKDYYSLSICWTICLNFGMVALSVMGHQAIKQRLKIKSAHKRLRYKGLKLHLKCRDNAKWVRNYLGNFNVGSWGMDKGCAKVSEVMLFLQMATIVQLSHLWTIFDEILTECSMYKAQEGRGGRNYFSTYLKFYENMRIHIKWKQYMKFHWNMMLHTNRWFGTFYK